MAGWGTRMRPHTWSKPKSLISVAGKTSLEHLLDMFKTIPDPANTEYVFTVGPYLGETQIPAFMQEHYPNLKVHFVVQHEMKGQSHALALAREYLHGPMIMCFSDTLIEADFSFLAREQGDGVAWVMPIDDPRRFGVAELNKDGFVTRFIEKPQSKGNNLAVVGCYYFRSAETLIAAIDEQIAKNVSLKNEFFLTDAITIMIAHGSRIRTQNVEIWFDTGTIDATLETNQYLLEHGNDNTEKAKIRNQKNVTIIPPVNIAESANINNSVIGPYVSIGANCSIRDSHIEDTILEEGAQIEAATLRHSLIGKEALVRGRDDKVPMLINIGDHSFIQL
jgi:glucose-1-phosphate thymidylyltransferase